MVKNVFFGASSYVIPVLQILDFELVVTTEPKPTDPVRKFCTENTIPCIVVTNRIDYKAIQTIRSLDKPVAILASFGLIIPQEVLDLFPKGILNIHPSLLPKYRGPTPVQTAILNGDSETGVTIIKLDSELDHGPIFAQKKRLLNPTDNSDSLYSELFHTGAELIKNHLNNYISGNQVLSEQNHSQATYTERLTRKSGYFKIDNPPTPEKLDRMIRAYYPWPGVWTKIQMENGTSDPSEKVVPLWGKILKFLPSVSSLRGVLSSSKNNEAISPHYLIQVEGKKPMTLKDFVNGYPQLKTTIEKILNLKS